MTSHDNIHSQHYPASSHSAETFSWLEYNMHLIKIAFVTTFGLHQVLSATADHKMLSEEQQHILLCVSNIANKYFFPESSLLVSLPPEQEDEVFTKPLLPLDIPRYDELLVSFLLREMNQGSRWCLQISRPGASTMEMQEYVFVKHHNYIVFTWTDQPDGDVLGNLMDQMDELRFSLAMNSRARFIFVVAGQISSVTSDLARDIADKLWTEYNIIDAVILIPRKETANSEGIHSDVAIIDIYFWVPYQTDGMCSDNSVSLIDKWIGGSEGRFLNGAFLFPNKTPSKFRGCSLTASAAKSEPVFVTVSNDTDANNNIRHIYGGLEIEYFKLYSEAMNVSVIYKPPPPGDAVKQRIDLVLNLQDGLLDVAFGAIPIHPVITAIADPTIIHVNEQMKWCSGAHGYG
ncbi:hypothetical protein ANN_00143 [Periplaneta americana]|uniref:Uncharacterized protein n=1 Tax=Periplaneta americana TaxID=6978 RepID=A0ABQ8TQ47_PERAM|nr:hypothetical protein ANN_00143 [Periplaneta americana]